MEQLQKEGHACEKTIFKPIEGWKRDQICLNWEVNGSCRFGNRCLRIQYHKDKKLVHYTYSYYLLRYVVIPRLLISYLSFLIWSFRCFKEKRLGVLRRTLDSNFFAQSDTIVNADLVWCNCFPAMKVINLLKPHCKINHVPRFFEVCSYLHFSSYYVSVISQRLTLEESTENDR